MEFLADREWNAELVQHVGLKAHDVVQPGPCDAFGMMRKDHVYGPASGLAQPVSQKQFRPFHIDTYHSRPDLRIGISV